MNSRAENTNNFTPSWPLGLLALSMALFLGWQVTTAAQQYFALQRLAEHQNILAGQAGRTESNLKDLMMDLLALSKTNAAAHAIVAKYGIKFNPTPTANPMPRRAQHDRATGSEIWTKDDTPRKPDP